MVTDPKERRRKLLEHIGRYRFTLREVVSKLFLEDKDPSNLLRKLYEEGVIVFHNRLAGTSLPGGFSYYQLSPEGVRQAGFPKSRANALDNRVPQYLAFLTFCCLGEKRRELLEPDQFKRCFPNSSAVHNEFYAVEKSTNGPVFYRLIYVGSSDPSHYVKRLSDVLEKAMADRDQKLLLSKKHFRPTLLLSEPGQESFFKELIKKSSLIPKRHRSAIHMEIANYLRV